MRQRGAALLLFLVGLLLVAATVYAVRLLVPTSRDIKQSEITANHLAMIQDAIVAYVGLNRRLPCPANPASPAPADDGKSGPESATAACNSSDGIVPWRTLGLSPDTILDGWNRRISYRVLDGTTGLTQTDGASMVNCDSLYPYGAPPTLPADGLCAVSHANTDTQFLAGKGLQVNDAGSLITGIAYALISHGETGYGAYLAGGNRMPMPTAGNELSNANAAGPFVRSAHSQPGIDPTSASHFDDILVWSSTAELARQAGLAARDWQDSGATVAISPSTTTAMTTAGAGHFNVTTAADGQTFSATSTVADSDNAVDTLVFGGGAASYSNCAWWPTSFALYNGSNRYAFRLTLEFATEHATFGLGGFTVGFLAQNTTDAYLLSSGIPLTGLCGDTTTAKDLGWGNGQALPSPLGLLQSPRFAVEFDAHQDGTPYTDPPNNHLAIDFDDVLHDGVSAATCSTFSDSYHSNGTNNDCYTGPSTGWLRDGLTSFHRLRVEIIPNDTACSSGTAPRMKVWVLPASVCPAGSSDAMCTAANNIFQAFNPTIPLLPGVVALERCIPAPSPSNAFDNLYFGITAANQGSAAPVLYLRNLGAGAFLTP